MSRRRWQRRRRRDYGARDNNTIISFTFLFRPDGYCCHSIVVILIIITITTVIAYKCLSVRIITCAKTDETWSSTSRSVCSKQRIMKTAAVWTTTGTATTTTVMLLPYVRARWQRVSCDIVAAGCPRLSIYLMRNEM